MDFETGRLRAFLHVAERGTVAAAADALGYSAPAVSQQVAKLEAQLGRTLFDRVGGRLRLTEHGRELLPLAHQMVDLAEQVHRPDEARSARRTITIAGFATALTTLVVPLLNSPLAARFAFEVHETEDNDSLRELSLGHIDIAIVQEYDDTPVVRTPRFDYRTVFRDRVRLLTSARFGSDVTLGDVADGNWLVSGAGTKCQEATTIVLQRAGIVPHITGYLNDNQALLALVAAGHGATIAPELVVQLATAAITISHQDLGVSRSIIAVTRATTTDSLADIIDLISAPPLASAANR
jgi:DNA-binding transcriptional LysR family regulator